MPELVRLYIRSVAIGFAISIVFAALLIWRDVMGIGHLIMGSNVGWIAVLMLVVFNGIIFAAVQFGLRVMMMAEDDEGPKDGHKLRATRAVPTTIPAVVPARSRADAGRGKGDTQHSQRLAGPGYPLI